MILTRSSMRNLAKNLFYPMSKKKLTQQWRKPIEQLRQEKQQNTPIPPDADHKKKIAMELMAEKYGKFGSKIQENEAIRQPKKIFKKKGIQQQTGQQSLESKQAQNAQEVNWLELQQFPDNKQLSDLINEALKMSHLKYLPQLKQILSKIKQKYHSEGLEQTLNSLFKQKFTYVYDNLKQIGIEVTKLNSKITNNIIFNMLEKEQFQKLLTLLNELKSIKFNLESKEEEIFEVLFWKETSHDVKFEAGENSVNISLDNKVFVQKLLIANQYLEVLNQHGKIKRPSRRTNIVPLWLNQAAKIVLRYRFAENQFRTLLTQVLAHHDYLLPESFYESEQFSLWLSEFYFGQQNKLKLFLEIVEKRFTQKSVKLSVFYRNFTNQLMNFRIQNGRPAFEVDETLIEFYKKAFEQHQKLLAIVCTIIASDAQYKDLAEHYVKSYMQGFPNESLQSDDTKFVEEGILNNYNRVTDAEKYEKNLHKNLKGNSNLLIKLKSSIKLNELQQAYNIFQEQVFRKVVIERMRKNIEFVLRKQLDSGYTNFARVKEISEFIDGLEENYLWSLYKKSEDVSVMVTKFIPEDKFSFWQEKQKQEQFQEISKKLALGHLNRVKQPQSDIQATGFSLQDYLETEFPQLRELEAQEYQKEKQLIKYILNVEGILFSRKIHTDGPIIEKLKETQELLGEENLALIETFGLKDYDIKQWGWEHFQKRFLKMKQQRNMIKDEKLDWSGYSNFVQKNKSLTKKNIIEEMMIKTPELFNQAELLVKLNPEPIVDRLLLWGVYTNEPMAVYLAQKLAMQTGQIIPHELALKVSRMLSYKRPLSEEFIQECKQCLKIVGKIDREFIYSFDKEYEHILQRKRFMTHVEDKINDTTIDNRDLDDLITFTPRQYLFQQQDKLYMQSIVSRAQMV